MMVARALFMEVESTHTYLILIRPQPKLAMQDRHRGDCIVANLCSRTGVKRLRCVIANHLDAQREMIPTRDRNAVLRQVA